MFLASSCYWAVKPVPIFLTLVIFLVVLHICLRVKVNSLWQAAADAKYYGNVEVYNILKARGAKVPVSVNMILV